MVGPVLNSQVREFLRRLLQDETTLPAPPSFSRLKLEGLHASEPQPGRRLRIGSAAVSSATPKPHIVVTGDGDARSQARASVYPFEHVQPRIFHQQAYQRFLENFDRIARLPTEQDVDLAATHGKVYAYWNDVGHFLPERTLIAKALNGQHPDLLTKELPKHSLTGFANPFKTANALALAHDYANSMNRDMALIAGDVANIGGTNKHFEDLLTMEWDTATDLQAGFWQQLGLDADELGVLAQNKQSGTSSSTRIFKEDIQPILEKAAHRLTDWSVQVMMGAAAKVFKTAPNHQDENYAKQVQLLGAGGDEFYITMPGSKALADGKIAEAMTEVGRVVVELDLANVPHLKADKPPGLGLAMASKNMKGAQDIELKQLNPKSEKVSATQAGGQAAKTLAETIEALDEYSDLDPLNQVSNFDPVTDLVLSDAKPASGLTEQEHYARRQLFNVFNPATGVQDTLALPVFLQQRVAANQDVKIVGVSLENLSAINDSKKPGLGQDKADEIQARFAKQLRDYVRSTLKVKDAEVFSDSGPGRFYVVVPSDVDVVYLQSAISGTSEFWVNNLNQDPNVGTALNSKRAYERGLSQAACSYEMGQGEDLDLRTELDWHNALLEQKITHIRQLREDLSKASESADKDAIKDKIVDWIVA